MSFYVNFLGGLGTNEFHIKWSFAPMAVEKIKIQGAIFEQPSLPIQPILPDFLINGPDWQCFLAGSSNTAPRILIFLIVLGAEY